MDVIVVVVFYVNTGHPTQLRQRVWLNLRLDSFSRPDARPQELCGAPGSKTLYHRAGQGFFSSSTFVHARNGAADAC
jgi:hypothetical protein